MALQPNISVKEKSRSSILLYECTGDFSSNNKGGFGGINPVRSAIIDAKVFVKYSKKEEYTEIDYTGDLPRTDGVPMEITPSLAGLSTSYFPSGKYNFKIEYQYEIGGTVKTKTGYHVVVLTHDIACCIDKLSPSLNENIMIDRTQRHIVGLSNLLKGAESDIKKGLYDQADKTIDYLNGQCKCSDC